MCKRQEVTVVTVKLRQRGPCRSCVLSKLPDDVLLAVIGDFGESKNVDTIYALRYTSGGLRVPGVASLEGQAAGALDCR